MREGEGGREEGREKGFASVHTAAIYYSCTCKHTHTHNTYDTCTHVIHTHTHTRTH